MPVDKFTQPVETAKNVAATTENEVMSMLLLESFFKFQ
jgi:hypothetical protein